MSLLIVIPICVTAAATLGLSGLRRRFVVIHVAGASMLPTFRHGDRVLVRRGGADRLAVGTVVVLHSPHGTHPPRTRRPTRGSLGGSRWVIKRVAALPGDPVPGSVRAAAQGARVVPAGKLVLLSDNPAGTDSRRWGLVAADDMLGLVIANLPRRDPRPVHAATAPGGQTPHGRASGLGGMA